MKRHTPEREPHVSHSLEQRQHPRITLDGTTIGVVDVESGVELAAEGGNVSGRGLMFISALEPVVGADLLVTLERADLRPMRATVQVLRVEPRAQGGFEVAGRITRVA
jgi:hypothetical protein